MNPSTKTEVEINQNIISILILLNKFLVYQWDPHHLQGSPVVYKTKSVFYLIQTQFCVYESLGYFLFW